MLRKTTLFLAASALVLSAPIAAQNAADSNLERTNVNADNIGPSNVLTIEGTVTEASDEHLRLKTDTGIHQIQIVDPELGVSHIEVGTRVSVDYTRTTQGVMIAKMVRPMTGTAESGSVTVRSEPATGADVAVTPPPADEPLAADQEIDGWGTGSRETDRQASTTMDDQLPQTGSDLPAVALLGLIGLAGAGALRRLAS